MLRFPIIWISLACSGCQLVFGLDGDDTPGADAAIPCTPGERAVVPGVWASGAVVADHMFVGYADLTKRFRIQAIDGDGALVGIPRLVRDAPSSALQLAASGTDEVALSFTTLLDGFDAVVVHTADLATLSSPARLTFPGVHATEAVIIPRGDQRLAAYRVEVTSDPPTFHLATRILGANLEDLGTQMYDLGTYGVPVQVATTDTGYLLRAREELLVAVDQTGVITTPPVSIAGAEHASLVADAQAAPALVRGSGGAIELVAVAADGSLGASVPVVSGRATITALEARETSSGTLVLWGEASQVFVALVDTTASAPLEVPVTGANPRPVAVLRGAAGPLVLVERDASSTEGREVVTIQACGL